MIERSVVSIAGVLVVAAGAYGLSSFKRDEPFPDLRKAM
jgi:hypothetical protein